VPRLNLPLPTLGGKQFWADLHHFRGWRIQRHVYTGHCRLVDPQNVRRAWGSRDRCHEVLRAVSRAHPLPAMRGKSVVVLHGLIRTRRAMHGLCRCLETEGGYTVFNVSYPSTRATIDWHAQNLDEIIAGLDGIDEINFVAHSLGNLVVRRWMSDHLASPSRRLDPRIRRMVMLGPPNQGAAIARRPELRPLLVTLFGPAGRQLARHWPEIAPRLAVPPCEFGVIAGGRGSPRGYNPLLVGDDDLVVTVEETRLAGAHDFAILPVPHTILMNNRRVQEYTLRFLKRGSFAD
jgi:pimeloyl-ACP methyl ester carboxylesterase